MQLLWDFREGQPAGCRLFHFHGAGVGHYMGFNDSGSMVFHRMVNMPSADYTDEIISELNPSQVTWLAFDLPFRLIPPAFLGAPVPEIGEEKICRKAGDDWLICQPASQAISMALPFFHRAQTRCRGFARYVLIHVHDGNIMVAAFNQAKPLLLNLFPAGNEAEALYFATAAIKKAGYDTADARVEIMAEEHASHALLQLFKRFIRDVAYCPAELPYSLGQMPPHADIASLMHILPQCALQEA